MIRALPLTLIALALTVSQPRAADTLPAQLSDTAFWKMVEGTSFSEPGGFFLLENFSSNEADYATVMPKLIAKARPGGVYLGVGPEQNFHYVASLKPRIAFIVDIRRQNMIQHLMYKAAFEMTSNRADFLSVIFSRRRPAGLTENSTTAQLFDAYAPLPRDPALAETNLEAIKDRLTRIHQFPLTDEDLDTLDHVFEVFAIYGTSLHYAANARGVGGSGNNIQYGDLMRLVDETGVQRSYLASEESFRIVKDLQQKNLLIPLVGNFGGPKAIRAVGQYLKDHGATVSVFYLSNVEQILFQRGAAAQPLFREFYENVATLPIDQSSTFIRSGILDGERGGRLTLMMSSIEKVLHTFKAGGIASHRDVLALSTR